MVKKLLRDPMVWIGVVVLVVLIVVFWPSGLGVYDEFASCLSDSGAVMYGTEWCTHCKDQKAMFGKSFEFVNFIDCDYRRDVCLIAGVSGYPTWVIDGVNYEGALSLERLSELTGCELVKG
jgi:glutaredoxin